MKDYKINCVGMSDEQKRLVQDAFFKLGYEYQVARKEYHNGAYYFAYNFGNVYRMEAEHTRYFEEKSHTELTFNQLLKLANMEEYMETVKFTKADLKDGMVVKYRGGCTYSDKHSSLNLVVANVLIQSDEFNPLEQFNNGLTHHDYTEFDIVEVFEVTSACRLEAIAGWGLKSVWKRPEPISAQQQAILDLEAKQQELIEAAKSIASDIAKLRGN